MEGHPPGFATQAGRRLPNAAHEARPWRIRALAADFTLEDVWALPVHGDAGDFPALIDLVAAMDPAASSPATRVLWTVRDRLGAWFGLGRTEIASDDSRTHVADRLPIPGTNEMSVADRLPADLRGTAADVAVAPFTALYRTDVEFAAELSNRTVHAILHLGWVEHADGRYQGEMAVYVKPRGRVGMAYMRFIEPFRLHIVYPALMRLIERDWHARRLGTSGRGVAQPRPSAAPAAVRGW